MKRKVIQIADSTQLISLPRKWCLQNAIKKGDELNVDVDGIRVIVSCAPELKIERAELRIKEYGILTPRVIYALYRKGIDELLIHYDKPEDVQNIQRNLRDATGYEIVEQDSTSFLIKNISSNIMGFDSMLRRTFLLLITLSEECARAISTKKFTDMTNILALEESNNHFTTVCRRFLNKYGAPSGLKPGPLYSIIQELEKVADEYKYLITALIKTKGDSVKFNPKLSDAYQSLSGMIRDLYESFYKFDASKISAMGRTRKDLVDEWYETMKTSKSPTEFLMIHHFIVIMQKVFNMIGPLLILNAPTVEQPASPNKYPDT